MIDPYWAAQYQAMAAQQEAMRAQAEAAYAQHARRCCINCPNVTGCVINGCPGDRARLIGTRKPA